MDTTTSYDLIWTDGRRNTCRTIDDARALILARYPHAEIGHDGDLSDGGERTLVWETPQDADNDSGALAVAEIRRA